MALNASGHTVIIDVRVGRNVGKAKQDITKVGDAAKTAGNKVASARQQFANLAGAFTGLMAAKAVARGLGAIIQPAAQFETAVKRIGALTGKNSAADLKSFGDEAKRVASFTPSGPVELADALLRLQYATGNVNEAMKVLGPTAQLSMASFGKMDIAGATKMTEDLAKAWGMTGDEIADASERIFAVSKSTGIQLENYKNVIARLAPVAVSTGQSFDEMLKQFSLVNRVIKQPERAIRLLGTSMTKLMTTKGQELLGGMGIGTTDDAGNMRRMSDIMLDLSDRWAKSTGSVRAMLAQLGIRSIKPITALLNQLSGAFKTNNGEVLKGAAVYQYLNKQIEDSSGNLAAVSKMYKDTTEGRIELFKEKITLLAVSVGNLLIPALQKVIEVLEPLVSGFQKVAEWASESKQGWLITLPAKVLAARVAVWGLVAAFKGFRAIIAVVSGNIGMTLLPGLVSATAATGQLSIGARLAGIALKGMWGWATLGLALLPDLINYTTTWYEEFSKINELRKQAAAEYLKEGKGGWWHNMFAWFSKNDIPVLRLAYDFRNTMDKSGDGIASAFNKALSTMKKTKELGKQAGNELYNGVHLASEEFNTVLKRIKSMSQYKPPVVKAKYFAAMQQRLSAAQGRVTGDDKTSVKFALEASRTSASLMKKAMAGKISPDEQRKLMDGLEVMGVVGQHVRQIYGPSIIGGGLLDNFGKHVTGQFARMGDPQNLRATDVLTQSRGGRYATSGARISGYNPHAGGYGDSPSKYAPWISRMFPKPIMEKTFPTQEGQSVLPGGPGNKDTPEMRQLSDLNKHVLKLDSTMQSVLHKLDGTLKVEAQSKDPMGSGGGPVRTFMDF